jgi:bacteriocin-like protein
MYSPKNGRVRAMTDAANGPVRADFWVGEVGEFRVLAGSPENQGIAQFTFKTLTAEELRQVQGGK